jgi:hypothetical protein
MPLDHHNLSCRKSRYVANVLSAALRVMAPDDVSQDEPDNEDRRTQRNHAETGTRERDQHKADDGRQATKDE